MNPLDRAFWLIILHNWTIEEVEGWGNYAASIEPPETQSWS